MMWVDLGITGCISSLGLPTVGYWWCSEDWRSRQRTETTGEAQDQHCSYNVYNHASVSFLKCINFMFNFVM